MNKQMENITFINSDLIEMSYRQILDAIEDTDSSPFDMTIRCKDEWTVIAACVNVGIDSHLEAIVKADTEFDNGSCSVHPHNLCILLRRLSETDFGDDDLFVIAHSLQSSILTVLGFDDAGKYVGREALGLE